MKRFVVVILAIAMMASILLLPASAADKFTDIDRHWAKDIINDWADRDVVHGYGDNTYRPDNSITRAEFATVIKNLLALTDKAEISYPDVKTTDWFYDAVACLAEEEIMLGDNGKFRPNDCITREEAFTAYARMLAIGEDKDPDLSKFADGNTVSDWAVKAMSILTKKGIVVGREGNKLFPKENITRAEVLALLTQTAGKDHIHYFVAKDGSCSICRATKDEALKFFLAVSSNDATVDMNVYNDYTAVVTVPRKEVDASNVKIEATMQNVASLGVGEKRHHEITIANTGMTGTPDLGTWLSNAFGFGTGYVKATIDGKECEYRVMGSGSEDLAVLTATSFTDIPQTREAWHALTAHVSTETQTADDSYILIKNGSYLQIAEEKLCFETENDLKLDNFNDISALKQNIRDNVKLEVVKADEEWQIVAELKAGTALAVGSSIAVLQDDATIKLKDLDSKTLDTILSELRDAESTYEMASILVKAINEVIGAVDGTTAEAPVVVEIAFAAKPE